MEYQVEKLEHFQHILLFEFNRGAKAAEAARNIFAVYEDSSIGESTARKLFSCFKEDRFDISDTPRSRRPSLFDDRLNTLIHNDPHQCTWELANVMKSDHFHHRATFAFSGQCSKIGSMDTAYSKPKPQNSEWSRGR